MESTANASWRLPNHGGGSRIIAWSVNYQTDTNSRIMSADKSKEHGKALANAIRGVYYELDIVGEHDCKNFTSI
jgi:hypothetical protein